MGAVLVVGLVACGGSGGKKNGSYSAEMSDEYATTEGHNYKDMLTVTYEDDVLTSVYFDSIRD